MRLALTDYLLRNYSEGRRSLLILDEAQHLTPDLLEELRLLGNLEGNGGRAVQVLLVGQMGLLDTLRLPELASFNQRLAVRLQVEPLNVQEAADYVLHQIRVAGGRPEEIITEEALEVLARATHGIPRLLNQAASQSLNLAHSIGAEQVDAEVVFEAIAALGLEMPEPLETHESPTHEDLMTDADPVFIEETTTSYSREEEPKTTLSGPAEHNSSGGRVHRLFAAPRRPA